MTCNAATARPTGALDHELKFYLMARGIPAKEAEALLIQAFVGEAIDAIEHEGIREALMDATAVWLLGTRIGDASGGDQRQL